jgi:CRISPR type IV-associated protein Csf2
MHTYIFEGVVTALTSISHIGETHGINSMLRREKVAQGNGTVEIVPIISGNSMRGLFRDIGMYHMLRQLGYGVNENGEVHGLSLAAYYMLFSGGALEKGGSRGLDIDKARQWREAIPLLALFGAACGNQMLPGKAKFGKVIPICEETAWILPDRFTDGELVSVWDLCQREAFTRKDDEKDEKLRQLIAPEVRGLLEAKAADERAKTGTDQDVVKKTGQKQQMRYQVETLAAGTRFFWEIALDDVTDVEFEAFAVTLAEFGRRPYIGGKSGTGHGKVSISFDKWIEINPRIAPTGKDVDLPLGNRYMSHLESHADNIRELLNALR